MVEIGRNRCFALQKDGGVYGLPVRELGDAPVWWAYAPLRSGPVGAPPGREWCALAAALAATGADVTLLGGTDGCEPSADTVAGLSLAIPGAKHKSVKLLSGLALGDLPSDLAIELDAGSAAALGARLALDACGFSPKTVEGRKQPPRQPRRQVAALAREALHAGPMTIYRGATQRPTTYLDLFKAHLGAWSLPFPGFKDDGMPWLTTETRREAELYVMQLWPGFLRCRVRQTGEAQLPASLYNGLIVAPVSGESEVVCTSFALRQAIVDGCAELIAVDEAVFRPNRDMGPAVAASIGDRFMRAWREIAPYKAVYQRAFTGLCPRDRWHGEMVRGRIEWTQKPAGKWGYPPIGALGIAATGARTASAVYRLSEAGYRVAAAHIDAVIVELDGPVLPWGPEHAIDGAARRQHWQGIRSVLGAPLPSSDEHCAPGDWRVKGIAPSGRFYAPGRWDLGTIKARMGGGDNSAMAPADFFTQRKWHGDPRSDSGAVSEVLSDAEV